MSDGLNGVQFEPLRAEGEGRDLFDPPSLFYLTHRVTIDRWAQLKEEASRATDDWLSTVVRPRIEQLAASIDWSVSSLKGRILLHPVQMPILLNVPALAIGLAWPPSVNPETATLWTGVRVDRTLTKVATRDLFIAEARPQAKEGWKISNDPSWPTYQYVDGVELWWTDLDRYQKTLVGEVTAVMDRFADAIVAVLDRFQ